MKQFSLSFYHVSRWQGKKLVFSQMCRDWVLTERFKKAAKLQLNIQDERRTILEAKRLRGSNSEVFSPVLSHLAAAATSYYAWALAMTIIIIARQLGLKNQSTHLADELPNDLLKREMALSQKMCQHSHLTCHNPTLFCSYPLFILSIDVSLTPLSLMHIQSQAFSVFPFKKKMV